MKTIDPGTVLVMTLFGDAISAGYGRVVLKSWGGFGMTMVALDIDGTGAGGDTPAWTGLG